MKQHEPVDEKIISVIYKLILGRDLGTSEDILLKKWLGSSAYYRNLLEDIQNDRGLRNKLLEAYVNDRDKFWKTVITYRAALP
jgi:hypothetical protein